MNEIELRYVAHVTALTGNLLERRQTTACSIRELVAELDTTHPGFHELFVNAETGALQLNSMIYYSDPGAVPVSVVDIDHPIRDGSTITFW